MHAVFNEIQKLAVLRVGFRRLLRTYRKRFPDHRTGNTNSSTFSDFYAYRFLFLVFLLIFCFVPFDWLIGYLSAFVLMQRILYRTELHRLLLLLNTQLRECTVYRDCPAHSAVKHSSEQVSVRRWLSPITIRGFFLSPAPSKLNCKPLKHNRRIVSERVSRA